MKRITELVVAVKTQAAMWFAGMIMLYVVVGWFVGETGVPSARIWQMLFLSLIGSKWQFICFGDMYVKRMGKGARAVMFALPFYVVTSAFAYFGGWLMFAVLPWILYTAAFAVVFGMLAAAYAVYFKITGTRYNQLLAAYQSRNVSENR